MNGMSDEEFKRIYGRPPIRKKKKKVKIYWNRIIIAAVIFIGIIIGFVKLVTFTVGKIKGGDSSSKVSAAVNDSVEEKKDNKKKDKAEEEKPVIKYSDVELIVCIDAGHGDYDGGTTSSDGLRFEKDDNLEAALSVKKYLEQCGVTVVMTREDDTFLELGDRCEIANNANADFLVCLHRNSYDGDISGVEAWVHNKQPAADTLLAANILEKLESVGISENRGVQYGYVGNPGINYYINADTVMPSCLLELGFLTDDWDNQLFDQNVDGYGSAIADAVIETAMELKIIDENGKRLIDGPYISEDKPINNSDSSSGISLERTEPATTEDQIYNTQENEYAM